MKYNNNEPDYTRTALAIFLVAVVMFGWQAFFDAPRKQQLAKYHASQVQKTEAEKEKKAAEIATKEGESEYNAKLSRNERLAVSPRITIKSDKIHGSISLTGARFDDLTLAKYKETLDKDSPEVILLSPSGDKNSYFAEAGWVATDGKTVVPNGKTVWKADKQTLAAGDNVNLRWDNGGGVTFILNIALDENYMFTINRRVENHSASEISLASYGYINRSHEEPQQSNMIMHEGPLGTPEGVILESSYKELREKGNKTYENAGGWLGIADKYWLAALIPGEEKFKTSFSHYSKNGFERYQSDYVGTAQAISPGASVTSNIRLFTGAKEINVLDTYTTGDSAKNIPPIPLFDRAVDFGVLYFLTKPLFLLLNFFFTHIGNFGIAIMLVTIVVKLCMYPLASKSYRAMAKMRVLQPEMAKLREDNIHDSMAYNKAMMELYKRHRVNPASGCLPLLLQMPVFIALYKVLYVTIEMRHAPFFGWLTDLSAADPSNIFTAFGLIAWTPPAFLHLGFLPILYTITMIIQQKQQPAPTDPAQATMMKIMPFALLFLFASFPAGLVLYWVWSNILSIIQQYIITIRHDLHVAHRKDHAAHKAGKK